MDHLDAELAQPPVTRRIGPRVGPIGAGRVGQRQVTNAELGELVEDSEGVVQGMAALDSGQDRYVSRAGDASDVSGRSRQLQLRIDVGDTADQLDLLERDRGRAAPFIARGHVGGQKLGRDAAITQSGDVGVAFFVAHRQVE